MAEDGFGPGRVIESRDDCSGTMLRRTARALDAQVRVEFEALLSKARAMAKKSRTRRPTGSPIVRQCGNLPVVARSRKLPACRGVGFQPATFRTIGSCAVSGKDCPARGVGF